MGSCNFKSDIDDTTVSICKSHFQFQFVIGKGGYGKVWKVEMKKTREVFAMKEMSKTKVISKKSVISVINERRLLSQLKHKFIVNMHYAFQDRDNLYLVMDLMPGGDLRYHLCQKNFTEEQCKFFISCILIGLEYLHSKLIIHRDIKPENLVLDKNGYLHITDLGVSRIWSQENSKETSGTPGYMAPEVMCRQNHGVGSDYFAVGIIAYEMMMKVRPYRGRSRKEIRDQILSKQVSIAQEDIPNNWSVEAADFINKLIKRKPVSRLGLNGPEEVKNHIWLKDVKWKELAEMTLNAPYKPDCTQQNFDGRISVTDEQADDKNEPANDMKNGENVSNDMFAEYYYNIHNEGPASKRK